MIYKNNDLTLHLDKKSMVYLGERLLFIGNKTTAIKFFISNSSDGDLNIKLRKRISPKTSTCDPSD